MIFQDISKHNKSAITFVNNLFGISNGILDLFHLFRSEIPQKFGLNNLNKLAVISWTSALFVG